MSHIETGCKFLEHETTFFNNRRTGLTTRHPWGLFVRKGSRVLCSDGKIRAPHRLAETSDTFFSVPAAFRINGRHVTGYVTVMEVAPKSQKFRVRRVAHVFRPHTNQIGNPLPAWPDDASDEAFNLLAVACDVEENK